MADERRDLKRVYVKDGGEDGFRVITPWLCPECASDSTSRGNNAPCHKAGCERMGYFAYVDFVQLTPVLEELKAIIDREDDLLGYYPLMEFYTKLLATHEHIEPATPDKSGETE